MNNFMVQGLYKSVKSLIQQQHVEPNYDDNYTCFCQEIININPFDILFSHVSECKKFQNESTFIKEFKQLPMNLLKVPHLLALKAEFLYIITQIDEALDKKSNHLRSPKAQPQVPRSMSQQSDFLDKYQPLHQKLKQSQGNKAKLPKPQKECCNHCGKPGDSGVDIECIYKLDTCHHSFCLGCLRKQINTNYIAHSSHIDCQSCQQPMHPKQIEQFIGPERLTYLKYKLKTGESPIQDRIPCVFCQRFIKQSEIQPGKRAVCKLQECQQKLQLSCQKMLPCKHYCYEYREEKKCLPCFICVQKIQEEYCSICYTETLIEAPCIQSACGHIFHYSCLMHRLENKWTSFYISFGFCLCSLCKRQMEFAKDSKPQQLLNSYSDLQSVVRKQASLRIGKHDETMILSIDEALDQFAFYQCSKCSKPYFGGKKDCQLALEGDNNQQNPLDLVCPQCCGLESQMCKQHGYEFVEYKCRFCCHIATFFCWGTTHFCQGCHKKQCEGQYLTKLSKSELPKCNGVGKCESGGRHKPNGEEHCLGCTLCKK